MEADRTAWLHRTTEAALDPTLPICDPHHHLWDYPQNRYLNEVARPDRHLSHQFSSNFAVVSAVVSPA